MREHQLGGTDPGRLDPPQGTGRAVTGEDAGSQDQARVDHVESEQAGKEDLEEAEVGVEEMLPHRHQLRRALHLPVGLVDRRGDEAGRLFRGAPGAVGELDLAGNDMPRAVGGAEPRRDQQLEVGAAAVEPGVRRPRIDLAHLQAGEFAEVGDDPLGRCRVRLVRHGDAHLLGLHSLEGAHPEQEEDQDDHQPRRGKRVAEEGPQVGRDQRPVRAQAEPHSSSSRISRPGRSR